MADSHPSSHHTPTADSSPILREVRAKRPWPPDFSKMSDLDKYRLERKYKRRARHKSGHPATWMKFTGILQILTLTGMSFPNGYAANMTDGNFFMNAGLPAYMILFMDWPMEHPFGPIRAWMWDKVDHFRGSPAPSKAPAAAEDKKTTKESR
ncbi:hypothetical protein AA313_de0210169 [Arthrobotrys entomopaga]|nr:hypothetical protein AA313_de0210169 [Arthrobotrys entomopaga]